MKIAIHKTKGFTEHWIAYCLEKSIPFKEVNCYDNDIIKQLEDCDVLMWHFYHANAKDFLFAKQLLYSVQASGKKVFPDMKTVWHFDDKVGQKYLLESINAPFVPTYIFYSKKEALRWIKSTNFPKVFKLRRGAGSAHVKLVTSKLKAKRLINRAFGRGFAQYDRFGNLKERWRMYLLGKTTFMNVLKGCMRLFLTTDFARIAGNEKGYVYFQDFIPNNTTDYRIKIVNGFCWGFQRNVRCNDFRASGSGELVFDNTAIPTEMLKIAFSVYKKLNLQSVAFDFIIKDTLPLILEMSYGFGFEKEQLLHGYWDSNLIHHEGQINPFGWMIENVVEQKSDKYLT